MLKLAINIPSSFYEEEIREGYLVSSEMKKVWAGQLDLLYVFSKICEKHELKWFVHAGTMLGAVRHHGFIPWDDDIDVVMPRADYEKLCKVALDELAYPYFYQNEGTDKYFARNFSRIRNSATTAILDSEKDFRFPFNQGIFIDVFPYDNIPEQPQLNAFSEELLELSDAWQWRNMVHFYRPKRGSGLPKRIKYFLKHVYYRYLNPSAHDYLDLLKKHHKTVTRYDTEATEYVGEMIIPPLNRHIWKKEWVEDLVYMPFEMMQVPVPSHYEDCLKASFGENWRTPINQPTMHWGVFFDAEKPYTEYIRKPRKHV